MRDTDYDFASRPCWKTTLANGIHQYTGELAYNDCEVPSCFTEYVGAAREKHTTTFTYDAENRPIVLNYDGGDAGQTTTTYDGFGRMSERKVKTGSTGADYSTAYAFEPGGSANTTTPLVKPSGKMVSALCTHMTTMETLKR